MLSKLKFLRKFLLENIGNSLLIFISLTLGVLVYPNRDVI